VADFAKLSSANREGDMDYRVKLNYPAILVAGVVYWLVQAVWYTVFANMWVVAIGRSMAEMKQHGDTPIPYIGSLVCDIIVACVLAWILARVGHASAKKGAAVGATLALGIVATILMTNYLFEQRPIPLFLINSGAALVGMTLAGTLVGAWRAKEPKADAAGA
jgi:hypothetical protein